MDSILATGGSTGHSDQDCSGGGMAYGQEQSHRLWPCPSFSVTFGGNRDPACDGPMLILLLKGCRD